MKKILHFPKPTLVQTFTPSFNDFSNLKNVSDWNAQYQSALDMSEDEAQSLRAKFARITQLSSDFVQIATQYGKTIIFELGLPPEKRTILQNQNMGGVAGRLILDRCE